MTTLKNNLTLRPVMPSDMRFIVQWLNKEYIRKNRQTIKQRACAC